MSTEKMVEFCLRIRFLDQPGEPEVMFLPFRKGGAAQCGMRPERIGDWARNTWKELVEDVSRRKPRRFKISYIYETLTWPE